MSVTLPLEEMRGRLAAAEADLLYFETRAMAELTPCGARPCPEDEPPHDAADAAAWCLARAREYRNIVGAWSAAIARQNKKSLTTN